MERKNDKKEKDRKIKVENEDGLTLSYDKGELKEKFPHLTAEITKKEKFIKINSIENKVDQQQTVDEKFLPDELLNPGVIDFLRRCTTNEEALEILDYLLKQKEISKMDYNSIKSQIIESEGLNKFIEKHGGFKKHGYYEKKYRNLGREKLNQGKS
ncbi:MAG: DUF2095 family protein [Candidatus Thorarchaeota archaeon]